MWGIKKFDNVSQGNIERTDGGAAFISQLWSPENRLSSISWRDHEITS